MSEFEMPYEKQIGLHTMQFASEDLYFSTFVDTISGPEMKEIVEEVVRFSAGKDRVFSIVDVGKMGGMSPEARKETGRFPKSASGTAIIGAAFAMRMSLSILTKAYAVMTRGAGVPLFFARDHEEALAWVAERRREIDAQQ